jgi:MFS family permease
MKTVIDAIFLRRHFWHKVKLNELSELYISLTLRSLGLGIIGIFIPVYFYEQGFSVQHIAFFFAFVYLVRLFTDPIVGNLVAKFGPKHIIRISFPIEILFLISIIAVGNLLIPMWLGALAFAVSLSAFMIPFHVDFSIVEDIKHAGQQLSTMTILEKAAGTLGPLVGGIIATQYGFEFAVMTALVITLFAAIPLYATDELRGYRAYKYKFKLSDYYDISRDYLVLSGREFSSIVYVLLWPLFAVLVVFNLGSYSGLGFITALGLGSTLLTAHLIGRIVDNKKGRELLRWGVCLTALSHIVRPIVSTVQGAIGMSIVGESVDSANRLPFLKGWYGHAEISKNGRVSYMVSSISIFHLIRFAVFMSLGLLTFYFSDVTAISVMMIVAGFGTLLMLSEKFSALNK